MSKQYFLEQISIGFGFEIAGIKLKEQSENDLEKILKHLYAISMRRMLTTTWEAKPIKVVIGKKDDEFTYKVLFENEEGIQIERTYYQKGFFS